MTAAALHLAALLEAENAALAALDLPRAGAMLAAKQQAMEALLAAPRNDAAPREAAMDALSRLRDAAERNRHLLERAIAAQEGVLACIARAARRQAPPPRYGAAGRPAAQRTTAMAVSTRI